MKKIILSLFAFISFGHFGYGQISWSPSGATWHNYYSSIGGNVGYVETKYVSDTLVGGMNCKKLVEHQRYRFYNGGNQIDSFKTHYTYEMDGVVFMFNLVEDSYNWDTLYNFNTPVNSSWHLNSTDSIFLKVYGAGIKIINSDTLQWRTINFIFPSDSSFMRDTLYERIGVTGYNFGFINPVLNYGLVEPSIHSLCNYQDNIFPMYGFPDSACTILPDGISNPKTQYEISISPNPATTEIKITNLSPSENQIRIFNLLGQQVKNIRVSNTQNTSINISDLAAGIYEVTIFDGEKIVCKKFVKE